MHILLVFIFLLTGLNACITHPLSIQLNSVSVAEDMIIIPAGKFKMGCDKFGKLHGAPERMVHLSAFMIDKYQVSNKKYENIIPDHKPRRSKLSNCDNCPVTNVSWYGAVDYCYLIGKTLPTEAQWEKASSNGDGCAFPWGDKFDVNANHARGGLKLKSKTTPVGSYSPNVKGLFDMGGNVWEWVSDWMSPAYNFSKSLSNPTGPLSGVMKVRRGGSYSDTIIAMRAGYRDWSYPSSRYFSDIGFRCVINIKRNIIDGSTG